MFETSPYEFYLSIKDLERDDFNLLRNLHIYTQKSVCDTSIRPFGEVGGTSPLQHSSMFLVVMNECHYCYWFVSQAYLFISISIIPFDTPDVN